MPRYFLNIRNNISFTRDEEGCELADADAARDVAVKGARSLMSTEVAEQGKLDLRARIEVMDEAGKIVLTFFGLKLRGEFVLVRVYGRDDQWLLIKAHDHWADPKWELKTILPPKEPQPKQNKSRSRKTPAYH